MKQCENCHAMQNDDATFCASCGAKMSIPQQSGAFDTAGQQPQQNPQGTYQQPQQNPQGTYQQPQGNPQGTYQQPQGNPQGAYNPNANGQFVPQQSRPANVDNRKTYCILSYISILWLFGLCSQPEKNDPRVRFNVGQGIMATIVGGACLVVAGILSVIILAIGTTEVTYFGIGTGNYDYSPVAIALCWLLWLAASGVCVFFLVYGIVKVCKDQDAYLPVIGKMAFYK